ncbi:MAG: type I-U CRISPR-associated helicase/endonuclease Cas3, partial [Salinisphaera sp.]|nr:type I-U CRISPR-associated helicase/endonuclease Cas3 [Salinisphaera sp.]
MTTIPDFADVFQVLWPHAPFPWQRMLTERLVEGQWPKVLDLPTAGGKTACMDAAIYALAAQAEKPVWERTAPRRIWFVVDRRIVVDEAFERARTIADKLAAAEDGPLKEVADRLRMVGGTDKPLAVARLRGGVLHDDGWARLPSQPAVITSTVDQLGSRLLFRGYGHSARTAPIFAGLAAHDSLILLDEAHLSVPFMQTLGAVERFRGADWAEEPIHTPFAFCLLSATPPEGVAPETVFPGRERDAALDHPVLRQRMEAAKPAELVATGARKNGGDDPLVTEAAARAAGFAKRGVDRVAVVVNRVATAQAVERALRDRLGDQADVVLLTGRLRPLERDRLVERWTPKLRANRPEAPEQPLVVVATQCIEVGADFSFGALVTEAASLDALRQRFGRLNRLGVVDSAPAVILIRADEAKAGYEDIVYGTALPECWRLLNELADTQGEGRNQRKVIDFRISALDRLLQDIEDLSPYVARAPDAALLLPAHLDLLCQTSPMPHVQPDIQLYLHGVGRGDPEVRVVWRADLDKDDRNKEKSWPETVSLCPPNSLEALSVPLPRLQRWLRRDDSPDDSADVEGAAQSGEGDNSNAGKAIRPALAWRGRERSQVIRRSSDLRPDELIVLPAEYGMEGLGQSSPEQALGRNALDIWEPTHDGSGKSPSLRLHREVLGPWLDCPPLAELIELAETSDWDEDALQPAIDAVLEYAPAAESEPDLPPNWLTERLGKVRYGKKEKHPGGGLILFGPSIRPSQTREPDLFADDDDLLSVAGRAVPLNVHSALVERAVEKLAKRCLPESFHEPLRTAAYWHDAGKLDERFQIWLRQGDELAAIGGEPLAKSKDMAGSSTRRRWLRDASGLPDHFRHEMLSLQVAERLMPSTGAATFDDLALHCVASHHGYGRPFAPFSADPGPPPVRGNHDGVAIEVSGNTRAAWPAPHSLASGIPERFWRLTRRYGWWGLAYLEAILRLGDWYGSQWTDDAVPSRLPRERSGISVVRDPDRGHSVSLSGIDGANPLGFLAALGTLAVLHQSGYRDSRLAWRPGVIWRPELSGVPPAEQEELAALVAEGLKGEGVSEQADAERKQAEKRLDDVKMKVKAKNDEIRRRGLRGKERQQALDSEVAPLNREQVILRQEFLQALRDAVPKPELALGSNIDCDAAGFRDLVQPLLRASEW